MDIFYLVLTILLKYGILNIVHLTRKSQKRQTRRNAVNRMVIEERKKSSIAGMLAALVMFALWALGSIAIVLTGLWIMIFLFWVLLESQAPTYPGVILTYTKFYWWVVLFTPGVIFYFHPRVRPAADHLLGNE